MTWPSGDVPTTDMDAGTDNPPRATFLSWAQKFNLLINHVTTFMQGVLTATDAAAARTAIGALSKTMNTGRLLGRTTASAGDAEEITPAGGLALSGGNLTVVDASTTVAGKSELATSAETQTGTDPARVVTAAGLGETVIGMGQAWQDVTASRSPGVTYTNTTGRPIMLSIRNTFGSTGTPTLTVGGVAMAKIGTSVSSVAFIQMVAIVPIGSTYSCTAGYEAWAELR